MVFKVGIGQQSQEHHGEYAVGYIATRELSSSGSEVAPQLNVDRSAISRAVQRAGNDTNLIAATGTILELLEP